MKTTITLALYIISGLASQYRPGIMPEVVANRQAGRTLHSLPSPLPPGTVPVAWPYCEEIGRVIELRIEGGPWFPAIAADCPGDWVTELWMSRNNVLVEFPGELAQREGFVGRIVGVEQRVSATRDKWWPMP
jgi:hypothetical protein